VHGETDSHHEREIAFFLGGHDSTMYELTSLLVESSQASLDDLLTGGDSIPAVPDEIRETEKDAPLLAVYVVVVKPSTRLLPPAPHVAERCDENGR